MDTYYEIHVDDVDGNHYGTLPIFGTQEEAVNVVRNANEFANTKASLTLGRAVDADALGMIVQLFRVDGDTRTEVFWK